MKFIKYSFIGLLFLFYSCEFLNNNDDDDSRGRVTYSCSSYTKINSWNKSLRSCSDIISYSKTIPLSKTGYFYLTMRNNSGTYNVKTSELTLEEGNHSIPIEINNCKFQDEVIAVCFMTR